MPVHCYRLILVDDNALSRAGILRTLRATGEGGEITVCDDAAELLRAVQPHATTVVIINYQLRSGALKLVKTLKEFSSDTTVLVVAMSRDPLAMVTALQSGVHGMVGRSESESYLAAAMRALQQGEVYLSPQMCATVMKLFLSPDLGDLLDQKSLTAKETDVLRLISQGASTKAIAAQMNSTVKAIQNSRARLAKKLHSRSTAELIRYAHEQGLVKDSAGFTTRRINSCRAMRPTIGES